MCFHISQFIIFIHEIRIRKPSPHIYGSLKTTTRLNDVFKSPQHETLAPLDQIKYYTNTHFYKTSHASAHNARVCARARVCVYLRYVIWHQLYTLSRVRDPQYLTDDDTRQKASTSTYTFFLSIKRLHAQFSTALSTGAQLGEKPISYQLTPDIHIMWYLCSFLYLLV
jgi:hypothetical protein